MRREFYILMFSLLLWGCNQKDIYFEPETSGVEEVDLEVSYNRQWQITTTSGIDWRQRWDTDYFGMSYDALLPEIPDGLRVSIYNDDDLVSQHNIDPHGGDIWVGKFGRSVLLFNNDTEYIVFSDMDDLNDAEATTRRVARSTYGGSPYVPNAGTTVNPPDMLYVCFIEHLATDGDDDYHATMQPLVFKYLVRYQFKHGIEYVAIARGALAGMAIGVSLESGAPTTKIGTVMYDCEVKPWGVEAIVQTFGAPWTIGDQRFGLNLEVRLKNGKILDFDYDITDVITLQPHGGVIEIEGIDIPDAVGQEDTGTFDVDIEGWGEFEDIPINF